MGGYGSGRLGHKQRAENRRSLDVNRLHREGCLEPGRTGNWVWSRDGREIARIGYRTDDDRLFLNYRVRLCGSDWEDIEQPTRLTYTPCNFGSKRPYFLCPGAIQGRHCGRRVVKLFSRGRYFLCRHCSNIAYSSQSETRADRLLRRANKLRIALGGEPGMVHWIAQKPKGMWQRTYQRKRFEIEWCESQANHLFISKFRHLFNEDELRMYFDT